MDTDIEQTEQTEQVATQGLYLVEPHGRLIADGRKTLIAKSKHLPLEGPWFLVSKENNRGLEYGEITVGEPKMVSIDKFDSLFQYHRVTPKERSRWWPTKIELYLYPITNLELHDKPKPVNIPAGTQTIMEKIEYLTTESKPEPDPDPEPEDPKPNVDPGQDRERPYSEVGAPRASDTHSDPAEKGLAPEPEQKETSMPWTVANPPGCAKKWTPEEKAKCVTAANAAKKGGASDQDAIFACIRAAGKTKHPGGEGDKATAQIAQELTQEVQDIQGTDEFITLKAYLDTLDLDEIKIKTQQPIPVSEPKDMLYEPGDKGVSAKGGRRLQSSKVEFLGNLKGNLESLLKGLGELIGWASYDDKKPSLPGALFKEHSGLTAHKALDGRTWLLTWTTNAFLDREGEIFTTKAINDYVARHAGDETKGRFDFWHLPGTEFGTIMWQGVEGRFLIESGPFDNNEKGRKAEEFFLAHPNGHPEYAPEGWGTSHTYKYKQEDRKDGVYDWFEKTLTTVLPFSAAANPHNPKLEVRIVDKKQYEALTGIWGEETAAQIVELSKQQTEAKEKDGVAFKSVEGTVDDPAVTPAGKPKDTEDKQTEAGAETGTEAVTLDGKELVKTVAEELQLGELSTAFKAFGDVVATLVKGMNALNARMETLEKDDEAKLAQKATQLPRYSWFRASAAAETVLEDGDALKSAQPRKAPSVVTSIAGKVN